MQRRPAGLRTDDLDWTREIAAVFGRTIPGHLEARDVRSSRRLATAVAATIAILCSAYGFKSSCHDMGEQAMENVMGYCAWYEAVAFFDETLWYLVT